MAPNSKLLGPVSNNILRMWNERRVGRFLPLAGRAGLALCFAGIDGGNVGWCRDWRCLSSWAGWSGATAGPNCEFRSIALVGACLIAGVVTGVGASVGAGVGTGVATVICAGWVAGSWSLSRNLSRGASLVIDDEVCAGLSGHICGCDGVEEAVVDIVDHAEDERLAGCHGIALGLAKSGGVDAGWLCERGLSSR